MPGITNETSTSILVVARKVTLPDTVPVAPDVRRRSAAVVLAFCVIVTLAGVLLNEAI